MQALALGYTTVYGLIAMICAMVSIWVLREQLKIKAIHLQFWVFRKLCPARLMDQGAQPSGEFGKIVLFMMENANNAVRQAMVDAASLQKGEVVAELGCANGTAFAPIAALVTADDISTESTSSQGVVVGVDPSSVAIELANERIKKSGYRATALVGSVGAGDGL